MFAWEVTDEDVATVLDMHGLKLNEVDVFEQVFADPQRYDRVVRAALAYTEFDDQVTSALDEIEDILFEQGVIRGEKVCGAP